MLFNPRPDSSGKPENDADREIRRQAFHNALDGTLFVLLLLYTLLGLLFGWNLAALLGAVICFFLTHFLLTWDLSKVSERRRPVIRPMGVFALALGLGVLVLGIFS